ncbi:unnamed protein product, partial [Prorocentrum cordatum]
AEQRGCAGGPRPAEGRVRLPAGPARWQAVPGWPRQAAAPRVPPWPLRRARGWRGRGPRQHGVAGAREARCGPGRRASRREAAQRPSGCRAGPCPALPCRLHARDVGEPRSRDGDGGTSYGPGQLHMLIADQGPLRLARQNCDARKRLARFGGAAGLPQSGPSSGQLPWDSERASWAPGWDFD